MLVSCVFRLSQCCRVSVFLFFSKFTVLVACTFSSVVQCDVTVEMKPVNKAAEVCTHHRAHHCPPWFLFVAAPVGPDPRVTFHSAHSFF